jgi:hypothetical protein
MMDLIKEMSILSYLRKKFPDEEWKASRVGFSGYVYHNNKGENGYWIAASAPRYDGDDDTFISEFYIYRKDKLPERIYFD